MTWEALPKIACLGALVITGLLMAPLLDGVGRKIKARIQHREGPPILQTLYDLTKLLRIPSLILGGTGFVLAPLIAFSAAASSLSLLPIGPSSPLSFSYDIFVYLYVLAMVSISLMIAGFSVQSAYANIGANREMMMILSTEPVLGIALGALALVTGNLSIRGIVNAASHLGGLHLLMYLLTLCLLTYCVYIECGFIPFDLAEAETEILEGPLVEYSGWLLGMFKWALLIKRFSLIWLLTSFLTAPWLAGYQPTSLTITLAYLAQLAIASTLYSCMVTYEALTPRHKIGWVVRSNLKAFIISIIYLAVVWWVTQS